MVSMVLVHTPPMLLLASKTIGWKPFDSVYLQARRPLIPAPIMAIFLPIAYQFEERGDGGEGRERAKAFLCLFKSIKETERDANVSLLERREEMSNKESLDGKNAPPLSHLICYILREFFLS